MATFTKQIDANIRDVDNTNNGGTWSVSTDGALNIGNPGAVTRNISLRFTSVNIPNSASISSAKITFTALSTKSPNITNGIVGVDEDNTAEFVASPEDTARTRTHTSASVSWTGTINETTDSTFDTPDITTIVQEIINRSGWSSGNAMAFWLYDNGSSSGNYLSVYEYTSGGSKQAILSITYTVSGIELVDSEGITDSISLAISGDINNPISDSFAISDSVRAKIPRPLSFIGMKISKIGIDVLSTQEPEDLIFTSDLGTLQYYLKDTIDVTVKSNSVDLEIAGKSTYTHNLGFYPYVEVYMKAPTGEYLPCPALLTGASTSFSGDFQIKENTIDFYATNSGYPSFSSNQTYTFIFFIFKNNLGL